MDNIRFRFDPIPVETAIKNPNGIKVRIKNLHNRTSSIKELISFVERGLTIQPVLFDFKNGIRFIGQQVFMFSVPHSIRSPKESIKILNEKHIPVIGGYTSFDNKSYVLILICEREVTDSFERRFIIQYVNHLLLQEYYCLSDDELFFGTNKTFNIRNLEARFKVENIVNLDNIASCFSCVNNFSKKCIAMLQMGG